MSSKRKVRPTYHSVRTLDQVLIDANSNTILMSALRGLYAGCIVCMIPLLAIVVGGPILDVMGII